MPVLITGAETAVGTATVRGFLRRAGEVRVYLDAERSGDEDAARFRAMGCKVALGTLDDEAHLETAMEQVHSVVHLAGGPLDDPAEQLDALATVSAAAIGAHVSRWLWTTELAADPAGNPYLEALAEAADIVSSLPMETIVFRCALRYGRNDPFTTLLAGSSWEDVGADVTAVHAPLLLDDLARALVTADNPRRSADLRLDVELVGPEHIRLGEFVSRLRDASPEVPPSATPPAWMADWLSRGATGGPDALGRQGTSLEEGLALLRAG